MELIEFFKDQLVPYKSKYYYNSTGCGVDDDKDKDKDKDFIRYVILERIVEEDSLQRV
jgi:hypothetical protein